MSGAAGVPVWCSAMFAAGVAGVFVFTASLLAALLLSFGTGWWRGQVRDVGWGERWPDPNAPVEWRVRVACIARRALQATVFVLTFSARLGPLARGAHQDAPRILRVLAAIALAAWGLGALVMVALMAFASGLR